MAAPISEVDFLRLVRAAGYRVVRSTKHFKIFDPDGTHVMNFPAHHKKGARRMVKAPYVKQFLQLARGGK